MTTFDTLRYFLDAYLSVVENGDLDAALREFAKSERPETVATLRTEIESVMTSEVSPDNLASAIRVIGNYNLAPGVPPLHFLTRLHEKLHVHAQTLAYRKPFDVFLSYASPDETTAKRIAIELKDAGFKVWFDQWEILVGDHWQEKTSLGLRSSDFFVILISNNSLQSRWVQDTLAQALASSEKQEMLILPVRLENCELPQPLKGRRYADLSLDRVQGMKTLLATLEAYRSRKELQHSTSGAGVPGNASTANLRALYDVAVADACALGWPANEAFKDVAIGPLDQFEVLLSHRDLVDKVKALRVELKNWGGAPFPYGEIAGAVFEHLPDRLRLYDLSPWVFDDWSFHYWTFANTGHFVQRTYVSEDHMSAPKTEKVFGVEWVLKDLCTPIMFAHRLSMSLKEPTPIGVLFKWSGLTDRRLVLLDRRRVPLQRRYKSSQNDFTRQLTVRPETDLQAACESLVDSLFSQFQWPNYPKDLISGHISDILSGSFPRG